MDLCSFARILECSTVQCPRKKITRKQKDGKIREGKTARNGKLEIVPDHTRHGDDTIPRQRPMFSYSHVTHVAWSEVTWISKADTPYLHG